MVLLVAASAACSNPLGRQYEYDEQIYLGVDGSATIVVNSSLPALVALRGAAIDSRMDGNADRDSIRRLYENAGCHVDKVGRFWYRRSRRFVQIQVSTGDLRELSKCALLSWSTYSLAPDPKGLLFRQQTGAVTAGDPGKVNWDGSEIVGFKVHAPSKVWFHNLKRPDGSNGSPERGNILTWEQRLADRRAGVPMTMEVGMESTSILYTTVWIFVGAFSAAVVTLVTIIWLVIRRGRRQTLGT